MKYFLGPYFWLFLASLKQTSRVASRSSQMIGDTATSKPYDQTAEIIKNTKRKGEGSKSIEDGSARQRRQLDGVFVCNCKDYCPDPNSSELQKLAWIENNPIFCKQSGTIGIENKPYITFCFFNCCRKCNGEYYKCVSKVARDACLKTAYECAGKCAKESLLNITIKGWY